MRASARCLVSLQVFGIKLTPRLGHGSFDAAVHAIIEADDALSYALLPMLDARLVLYKTFRELDNRTRHLARDDGVCQLFITAPGVGFIFKCSDAEVQCALCTAANAILTRSSR